MIEGIGHVAFAVADLEASLDFYCRKLGFREAFRLDREGEPSPWIVYVQTAPGCFIELFPVGDGPKPERGGRTSYSHFCMVVADLAATLKDLRRRGLSPDSEPQRGLDHNLQAWVTDPDGNRIELMQVVAESPQASADRRWASGSQ
jgi:catechol 2,3-dioxygenase-like lactoylglutathione lyase family enzyme